MGGGDDNSQLDWLPADWKMEVKARKNGRKDKNYIDPSNEHKFQSKPEVLRYLKNVENNHLLCEESKKGSSTDGSPAKFLDKEAVLEGDDNSPLDCLPAGWKMEVKVRKNGRKDRYYIDPSNEHKFQSKLEVFRYLKNVENNHPPSEESKKGSSTDGSPAKFVDKEAVLEGDDNSPLDWLPVGWKMEVKVRKNGKKDKYYIDPSNEHKYQSKPEVLRYLKNEENNHPPSEESKKGNSTDGSPTKFVDKEAVSEDLPEGWIKKFRVTRSGSSKDPYYIDPVSGQQFVSMEEVSRYLNSKKTDNQNNETRAASNPEDKSSLKSGAGDHATIPSTAERRKLRSDSNKEVQKPVRENQITKTESSTINQLGHKLKPCKEKENFSVIRSLVLTESAEKKETAKLVKTQEDISVEKMEIDRPVQTENIQTAKRVDTPEDIQTVGSKNKRNIKREIELPRRSSKRLAGVEVELPQVLELPTRVRPAAMKPAGEDQTRCSTNRNYSSDNSVQKVKRVKTIDKDEARRAVIDALFNEEQGVSNVEHPEQGVANVVLEKHPEQGVAHVDLEKHPEQGVTDVIIPKQQADKKVADVITPKQQDVQKVAADAHAIPEKQGEQEMDLVSSLGGLWNDPCIEFAIKTLTGDLPVVSNDENLAKNSVDAAGPSSCQDLPLGDLWSDPCFEFAVKTLTGDIQPPVDTTCIQTNFQQKHWSSKSGANGAYR